MQKGSNILQVFQRLADAANKIESKAKFANDIILEENTDPQILGGFVLQVEDTLINCSIKNHLNKIKNSILERSKSYGI